MYLDRKELNKRLKTLDISKDVYGDIQWKGTDVCIDIFCACGAWYHFDGYFMYRIKCKKCGKIYLCNSLVQMIEITEEQLGDDNVMELDHDYNDENNEKD